ncbi:hypothetical protein [Kaistella yonginensis]|uniref:hypothetical protein n=1 Tax=Kaistella yonginensis TaxID=658267 RepID=UPI0025B2B5E6|nr:hypothetical protein [Kaistella yonginensis]MDN3607374.1 hypothetical protein [Kaistella yonginensis]
MKKHLYIFAFLSLIYCSKESKTTSEISVKDSLITNSKDTLQRTNQGLETKNTNKDETLKSLNDQILSTLKAKDYTRFSSYIHPEKGVQFSMYAYIQPNQDKRFTRQEFIKYAPTNIKFTWGEKDGSGDKLVLSIKDYFNNWVFNRDFTKGEYQLNTFKGSGNSLNNLQETYAGFNFTENFLPGSEQYSGMDWNSLRLVFEELHGTYYLVAVINDEWTI